MMRGGVWCFSLFVCPYWRRGVIVVNADWLSETSLKPSRVFRTADWSNGAFQQCDVRVWSFLQDPKKSGLPSSSGRRTVSEESRGGVARTLHLRSSAEGGGSNRRAAAAAATETYWLILLTALDKPPDTSLHIPVNETEKARDFRMNHLSLSELCCLFCCPPCPSKIASKLAFLPPEPTYTLMCDESGSRWTLHLSERADWQYSAREKDAIECFMTRTSRGNRIACMFVRCSPNARYTLLFSHGNAVDLGQMSSFYIGLGSRINCNVFSYDYSGYGASSGKPSEKNLYADVDAAWQALRTRYGIRPENVIIYGQSIGTVPSVDLAARYESAAVILHSPLTSGMRVAFPDTKKTYCFDAFPNIDKISKVTSPVLVIHGTEDEVIDFSHGLALYERCQRPVEPLWVEGAGHNDVELYGQYLERLKQFVAHELVNL
ncbi:hypothetical protein SRHO_G00259540 [Serrasalmus rhombeus]